MNIEQIIINTIKEKLFNVLNDYDDLKIISSQEFKDLEERSNNMVIVGFDSKENLNPGLPDFKYTLKIVVNSFIADDNDADLFNDLYKPIQSNININLFGRPVCGFFYNGIDFSEDGESHIAILKYDVFISL